MLAAARRSLGFMTRGERTTYFAIIALRSLAAFLDVFGIFLIGLVAAVAAQQLDPAAAEENGGMVILGFQLPVLDSGQLFLLVIFVLAVFILKATISILLMRWLSWFIAGVEARNARAVAEYLLRGSLASAKRFSKAELQYAITEGSNWAFTGILNNFANILSESFLLIVIAAAFVVVNPVAALFAFGYFAIVMLLMQYFIGRSLKRAGEDAAEGTMMTANTVSDTIDTFREISVLSRQDLFVEKINKHRLRVARSGSTLAFLSGMPRYIVETALILGVVLLVGQQLLSGNLAGGLATLGVFLTGGVRIMASLLPLQTALAALRVNAERSRAAQNLLGEVRQAEADRALEGAVTGERPDGLDVVADHVRFAYAGDEHDTIRDVSLTIPAGAYAAIIGPSGAGKTTLVDLMLGLISPTGGSVLLGGLAPSALRKLAPGMVSYVPQKPGLVSGTIRENIALGIASEEIDDELLEEVIDAAYLREFIDGLPEGHGTSVGKQVDALSGGQIQRIGLARALYARPRLLILDEATSGLDAGSEAFVGKSLAALHGRVTVIVIAHRLSTVQHADVVFVIEEGRMTASGDFKTVRATVPMVAEYVKLMSFSEA
jgi:ATP-binding cassette subfamily C protein